VAGIFADGQFGSLKGTISDAVWQLHGFREDENRYAAGVRLGYLVAPNVLSYVNAGYSGSSWSDRPPVPFRRSPVYTTPSFTRNGVFIGGGVENNLNIFGIAAPGWFMKTEYRPAIMTGVTLAGDFLVPPSVRTDAGFDHLQALRCRPQHLGWFYRFNWTARCAEVPDLLPT